MNAEFQWWLLILGIVIGGSLVYLVLADLQGDREVDEAEADDLAIDEPWEDADDLGEDADDVPRWTPQATPAVPASRTSARDDADVQRDGAQGETSVADLP